MDLEMEDWYDNQTPKKPQNIIKLDQKLEPWIVNYLPNYDQKHEKDTYKSTNCKLNNKTLILKGQKLGSYRKHLLPQPLELKTLPVKENQSFTQPYENREKQSCLKRPKYQLCTTLYKCFQNKIKGKADFLKPSEEIKKTNDQLQRILKLREKMRKRNHSEVQRIKQQCVQGYNTVFLRGSQQKKSNLRFASKQKLTKNTHYSSYKIQTHSLLSSKTHTQIKRTNPQNSKFNDFATFIRQTSYI